MDCAGTGLWRHSSGPVEMSAIGSTGATPPAPGIIATGPDEISIYVLRNYWFPTVHLERMVLRTDGFVAVHAGSESGELVDEAAHLSGKGSVSELRNFGGRSIRVEVQDLGGKPLAGFRLAESPIIWGDEIEHRVRWQHEAFRPEARVGIAPLSGLDAPEKPLAALSGKPIRLRFVLEDADLYSIRFR